MPPLSVASPRAPEVTGGWRYNIAGAARRSVVIRVLERVVVLVVPGLLLVVRVAPPGGGEVGRLEGGRGAAGCGPASVSFNSFFFLKN